MTHAIAVDGIGKQYRLAGRRPYGTLRDSIVRLATASLAPAAPASSDATFWALRHVSFTVDDGEVIGILGRNGSGKSTLLKILSRITSPSAGKAMVRGRIGSLLEVGTGFHQELSGRENVFVNGAILGMKRREIARKFDEIVAFADVERFIDTPIKHYSSGMKMRLAFAVAAHLEPDILLVDEVLAVGDLEFQKKCLGKMDDVRRTGRTILFVSHQMNQLRRLCQRCVWLDAGEVRQVGAAGDTLTQYERAMSGVDGEVIRGQVFSGWQLEEGGHVVRRTDGAVALLVRLSIDRPITHGHFGVGLWTDADDYVLAGWAFESVDLPAGTHTLRVVIKSLPLRPGSYRWSFTMFDHGSNLTGGKLLERWSAVPALSLDVPPLSHPQDAWAGVLNVPASLDVQGETATSERREAIIGRPA